MSLRFWAFLLDVIESSGQQLGHLTDTSLAASR